MVWTVLISSHCSMGRWGSAGQFCFTSFLSDGGWGWIICRFDWAGLFQNTLEEGTFTSLAVDSGCCCKFTCPQGHLLVLLHGAKHFLTESWLLHDQPTFVVVQTSKKAGKKLLVLLNVASELALHHFFHSYWLRRWSRFGWKRIRLHPSMGDHK